jgi:hypothetical protein
MPLDSVEVEFEVADWLLYVAATDPDSFGFTP